MNNLIYNGVTQSFSYYKADNLKNLKLMSLKITHLEKYNDL